MDRDVPGSPSRDVYISRLARFTRVCSVVSDFNNRNQYLAAKILEQCYLYHTIRKAIF